MMFFQKAVFNASVEGKLLGEFFSAIEAGVFCDIGANTPGSAVSMPFLKKGWSGVAVDPIPRNANLLIEAGFDVYCGAVTSSKYAEKGITTFYLAGDDAGRKSALDSEQIDPDLEQIEIEVPLITLYDLLKKHNIKKLDLLAIDVEGHEVDVLDTLPSDFSVGLILIEDWARDLKIDHTLTSKGYKRVRRTGYNSWYVKKTVNFDVSLWGKLHLLAKLKWFNPIRKRRFERKKEKS
jgi:FkbM family methyltransferase